MSSCQTSLGRSCEHHAHALFLTGLLLWAYSASAQATLFALPDTIAPSAEITELHLPDGSVINLESGPIPRVAGTMEWFRLWAETEDPDVAHVRFEFSLLGNPVWSSIDLNDDDDFYANLDGRAGYDPLGGDEIFLDLDGDFIYGPGDLCTYGGSNGVIDAPWGFPLRPLVSEDFTDGLDNDLDGAIDEDDWADPRDYHAPYFVYFDFSEQVLSTDTVFQFRAVATDIFGNSDPESNPISLVIIGENQAPETDILSVFTSSGDPVDVWPLVLDGDGVDQLGFDPSELTLDIHVVATDPSGILLVDLFWRWNADCYPDLQPWENPWRSLSMDGFTTLDQTYPYDFTLDLAGFRNAYGDGAVQFYPAAMDASGNQTPGPETPWAWRLLLNRAHLSTSLPDSLMIGSELVLEASLTDPADATVYFHYAERYLGVEIDPEEISPHYPYLSPPLTPPMPPTLSPGRHALLLINNVPGTYHEDLSQVSMPTKYDWSVSAGAIEFGAPPDLVDVILLDYNVTEYEQVGLGDAEPPYTGGWLAAGGGVPQPVTYPFPEAYDLIATMQQGDVASEDCELQEYFESELKVLNLICHPQGLPEREHLATTTVGLEFCNPFRPGDRLRLALPNSGRASMRILDLEGRTIATLLDEWIGAGSRSLRWSGNDRHGQPITAGVYFICLQSADQSLTRRILLAR